MLGRFSSKVGSLLDELADVLGAFEGIPVAQEGQLLFRAPPPYRTLKLLPAAVVPLVLLRLSNQHFPSIAIWVMLLKHCIGPGQLHTASLGHSPCLLVLAFIQQFSCSSVPSCCTHVCMHVA